MTYLPRSLLHPEHAIAPFLNNEIVEVSRQCETCAGLRVRMEHQDGWQNMTMSADLFARQVILLQNVPRSLEIIRNLYLSYPPEIVTRLVHYYVHCMDVTQNLVSGQKLYSLEEFLNLFDYRDGRNESFVAYIDAMLHIELEIDVSQKFKSFLEAKNIYADGGF